MGKCQGDVFMDIDVLAHIFYCQVITESKGQLKIARNASIQKLLPFFLTLEDTTWQNNHGMT